jgi:hypothetical protein
MILEAMIPSKQQPLRIVALLGSEENENSHQPRESFTNFSLHTQSVSMNALYQVTVAQGW